jgi:hypothetical protein
MNKIHPEYNAGQPAYVAWLKATSCDTGGGLVTSASSTIPYTKATILSTFNADTQTLNVKLWANDWNNNTNNGVTTWTPQFLWANVDIHSGPNVSPPLGTWSMQYCEQDSESASSLAQDPSTCNSHGYATVTPQTITVWQSSTRSGVLKEQIAGVANYTVSGGSVAAGQGQFHLYDNWNSPSPASDNTYSFNFSGDNYSLWTNNSAPVCMNRNIGVSAPWINSWSGNLYDTSGNLVNLNGGFTIKLSAGQVSDWSKTGWVNAWGPWFPTVDSNGNTVTVNAGQTVYSNAANNMDAPYTYMTAPGSLQKVVVTKHAFDDFKNQRFMLWLSSAMFNGASMPVAEGDGNYQVYWDGTKFISEGKFSSDGQSLTTQNIENISLTALNSAHIYNLNGNIPNGPGVNFRIGQWDWNGSASVWTAYVPNTTGATAAYAWQTIWSDVYPGTDTAGNTDLSSQNLSCYGGSQNCPTASADGVLQSAGNYQSGSGTAITYAWDSANGLLKQNNFQASSSTQRSIGPLFLASDATVATNYACGPTTGGANNGTGNGYYDANGLFHLGGICTSNAWNMPGTFYMWNTNTSSGAGNWPARRWLADANGHHPIFDKPISVTYTPSSGALANVQQVMTYNGAGQFWVPSTCYSKSTRTPQPCTGGSSDLFYSDVYTIPFNPTAGVVSNYSTPSTQYLVKFLGQSYLYGTSNASCTGLTQPTGMSLPVESSWADPHAIGSGNFLGAWQAPSQAPKYIDGVAQ